MREQGGCRGRGCGREAGAAGADAGARRCRGRGCRCVTGAAGALAGARQVPHARLRHAAGRGCGRETGTAGGCGCEMPRTVRSQGHSAALCCCRCFRSVPRRARAALCRCRAGTFGRGSEFAPRHPPAGVATAPAALGARAASRRDVPLRRLHPNGSVANLASSSAVCRRGRAALCGCSAGRFRRGSELTPRCPCAGTWKSTPPPAVPIPPAPPTRRANPCAPQARRAESARAANTPVHRTARPSAHSAAPRRRATPSRTRRTRRADDPARAARGLRRRASRAGAGSPRRRRGRSRRR
jgi:hypothetical protein